MLVRKKRRRQGVEFLAASAAPGDREALKDKLLFRIKLSDIFFILFASCIILAFSGPRWGTQLRIDNRRGLDLVLAFDISRSMDVRDCPPLQGRAGENSSRLERALAIARELTLRLEDVRLASSAGKGMGVLMVPLTYDSEAILSFLDSLDSSFLTGTGTNLESLIDAAMGAFNDAMNRRQGIIFFSDGEDLEGSLESALNRARARGIVISAVGLGSDRGAAVPVETSSASPGGVLLASDGSPIISSRQEKTLKNAAERTSGLYVDGLQHNAASALTDYLISISAESLGNYRREAAPRWHIFTLAGLAFLGISRLLGFRRKKLPLISALLCFFSLSISSCTPIQGKLLIMEGNFYRSQHRYAEAISSFLKALEFEDVVPYAEYGLGLCYSSLDEKEAALERYHAAEEFLGSAKGEHQELRFRLTFNTGIIHFEQGDYSGATDFFRKALEIDGSRIDAKRNLELSLLARSMPNQPEPASSASAGTGGHGMPALFDYLRLKEQEQWKSREWSAESGPLGPDY